MPCVRALQTAVGVRSSAVFIRLEGRVGWPYPGTWHAAPDGHFERVLSGLKVSGRALGGERLHECLKRARLRASGCRRVAA